MPCIDETTQMANRDGQCADKMAYSGTKSTTRTGRECQKWTSEVPHVPYPDMTKPEDFPEGDIDHNYCRNPDNAELPWCYTMDPNIRWEFCFYYKGTMQTI